MGDPPAAESGLALLNIVDRLQSVTSALQDLYNVVVVPIVTMPDGGGADGAGVGVTARLTRTLSFGGSPGSRSLIVYSTIYDSSATPLITLGAWSSSLRN